MSIKNQNYRQEKIFTEEINYLNACYNWIRNFVLLYSF